MDQNIHASRIEALRVAMRQNDVKAVVIPRTDPHLSEYISDHWHIVRWLSGFSGSAANMVVTLDKALLWTDSRYFLQAALELEGSGVELMKEGLPDTPSIPAWLAANLCPGDRVAIDGMVCSMSRYDELSQLEASGLTLVTDHDFIGPLWADRPQLPEGEVFVHELKHAGETADSKIARVLAQARAMRPEVDGVLISALDEIAWTLNIRSSDVPCNPVATGFLYLSDDRKVLFILESKISDEVRAYLAASGVETRPYDGVKAFLAGLPEGSRVGLSSARTAVALFIILGPRAVAMTSPVAAIKAVKNDVQIAGTREAMKRDGVALVAAFRELESRLAAGEQVTEMDVAEMLTRHRSAQPLYFEDSFETIAGFGPHGAIVHYTADETSNSVITPGTLLLIDSGANYIDGTTDITRTIAIGEPTDEMRHDFTLVMKGHIAIATARFPECTTGHQLDALARMSLWREGKSYLHGTGHGVGHFLNVHEGPQSIRLNDTHAWLVPGMITSNEPGVYLADRYGIRCENLVLTVPSVETEFGHFFEFETLTLFPFDRKLFDTSIMTPAEIAWVDNYHARVRQVLTPMLDEASAAWLAAKTAPLL